MEIRLENAQATMFDERKPVVAIKDGKVSADSRDVAALFTKEHRNVLRDIRELIAKEPSLGLLNFEPFTINDLTGESTSHYEMDRDGFTLLAMGFTGEKALKWKLQPRGLTLRSAGRSESDPHMLAHGPSLIPPQNAFPWLQSEPFAVGRLALRRPPWRMVHYRTERPQDNARSAGDGLVPDPALSEPAGDEGRPDGLSGRCIRDVSLGDPGGGRHGAHLHIIKQIKKEPAPFGSRPRLLRVNANQPRNSKGQRSHW